MDLVMVVVVLVEDLRIKLVILVEMIVFMDHCLSLMN